MNLEKSQDSCYIMNFGYMCYICVKYQATVNVFHVLYFKNLKILVTKLLLTILFQFQYLKSRDIIFNTKIKKKYTNKITFGNFILVPELKKSRYIIKYKKQKKIH